MTTAGFVRSTTTLATPRTTLSTATLMLALGATLAALLGQVAPAGIALGATVGLAFAAARGNLRGAGAGSTAVALGLVGILAVMLGELVDYFTTGPLRLTPLLLGLALALAWRLAGRQGHRLSGWQQLALAFCGILALLPVVGTVLDNRLDLTLLGLAVAATSLAQRGQRA